MSEEKGKEREEKIAAARLSEMRERMEERLEAMKSLPLAKRILDLGETENDILKSFIDDLASYSRMMRELARSMRAADEALWKIVNHEYPETKNWVCSYSSKKKCVALLYPKEKNNE
jgi:hypothetical protein